MEIDLKHNLAQSISSKLIKFNKTYQTWSNPSNLTKPSHFEY